MFAIKLLRVEDFESSPGFVRWGGLTGAAVFHIRGTHPLKTEMKMRSCLTEVSVIQMLTISPDSYLRSRRSRRGVCPRKAYAHPKTRIPESAATRF